EGDSFEEESKKDDPKFISAPRVQKPINDSNVQITGDSTVEEAQRLADIINSGSLPVKMDELYTDSVVAQFGEQALNQTVFAAIIGIILIAIFMIAVYRFICLVDSFILMIYVFVFLLIFDII